VRVVLAPDSFKESLTSPEVAAALERGWLLGAPGSTCVRVPLADGGEGTVRALVEATGGRVESHRVTGPLGEPVDAELGILGGPGPLTAVVEVAAASGLALVAGEARDAGRATSYGTGELVSAALDAGARRIVLGLGGSACTDGGAGMLQALGVGLLDAERRPLAHGGLELGRLEHLDLAGIHPALAGCEVVAACDVDNPLCGREGAAAVFGPQKGADAATVEVLDGHLARLARTAAAAGLTASPTLAGTGAAGGIGFAVVAFLGGELRPGFEIVADAVGLDEALDGADLVLTGEGRIDAQSLAGKAPVGVLRRARGRGVPVVAVAGSVGDVDRLVAAGLTAAVSVVPGVVTMDEALAEASDNLERTARALAAVWAAATGSGWRR
jgi:glycerate kinase